MHPEQKKIYMAMSPEEKKLQVAPRLHYSAKNLKEAALALEHPDRSEKKIKQEVKKIFINART
jgi:hypothetical protein